MDENETNKLVKGALLLTVAGFISKILSAGYRIPLQNLTGDFGFYVYQQIYPILGIVMILSLYGFPSAVSKLTAELREEGKALSFKNFYLPLLLILIGINSLFFVLLYVNADALADWVGDKRLKTGYRYAAFAFLLIPLTSLIRGVFQGNSYMQPTAYSQIGEQFFRVFIIIFSAYLFFNEKINVYMLGKAGALASIVGSAVALIILSIFFLSKKPFESRDFKPPWKHFIRTIFLLGIIAALNHMVLLMIQFADVLTLIPNLLKYGLSPNEAMEAKGVFDRGQPLIQLGTVLGSSFALALIPNVSKKRLQETPEKFYQSIQSALAVTLYLSIAAVIGLILIFPETNTLLYQNAKGTFSLQILSIVILLSSITITIASILQGLGFLKQTAVCILITFVAKWVFNQIFVPYIGITGSSIATVLSMIILCILILWQMKKVMPKFKLFQVINWKALLIAGTGLITYIKMIHFTFPHTIIQTRLVLLIYVLFIVLTGALIYIFLLLKCRAFKESELTMLPFSSFFIRIHKGRD